MKIQDEESGIYPSLRTAWRDTWFRARPLSICIIGPHRVYVDDHLCRSGNTWYLRFILRTILVRIAHLMGCDDFKRTLAHAKFLSVDPLKISWFMYELCYSPCICAASLECHRLPACHDPSFGVSLSTSPIISSPRLSPIDSRFSRNFCGRNFPTYWEMYTIR